MGTEGLPQCRAENARDHFYLSNFFLYILHFHFPLVRDETCEEMQPFLGESSSPQHYCHHLPHALLLTDSSQPASQANVGIDKHSQFVYIKPVKTKGPGTPASSALLEKDGKLLVYAVYLGVKFCLIEASIFIL